MDHFGCSGPTGGGAAVAEHARQPDRYLTDGVTLCRSLGALATAMGQMVALENCRSLDVMLLPIGQLCTCGLRVVIPDDDQSSNGRGATMSVARKRGTAGHSDLSSRRDPRS